MNGYLTAQEAADKWEITVRQVQILCKDQRIEGAERIGKQRRLRKGMADVDAGRAISAADLRTETKRDFRV